MSDLFGVCEEEVAPANGQLLPQHGQGRIGVAGELLTLADLKIRGCESLLMLAEWISTLSEISTAFGAVSKVKASDIGNNFG